jgi:AP-1 complex subunit sigma 1/2
VVCVDVNESEMLDALFGNIREVDIITGFDYAYMLLDEIILGGDLDSEQTF